MAQFDVHRLASSGDMVVDCQADILTALNTRLVVPLLPIDRAPGAAQRLNPIFTIAGLEYALVTQFAAAVQVRELGETITTLRERSFDVIGALDVLISGV